MNDDDYNLIYSVVDEVLKNVLKPITEKALELEKINFIGTCNIGAVCRLLKLGYPRIDPGDTSTQSHIFSDSPAQSKIITFTSTYIEEKVEKLSKLKMNNRK